MTDSDAPNAPSSLLAALEMARASMELTSLMLSAPLLSGAPEGDKHRVVVLPGFMFDSKTTLLLRGYLRWLGYRVEDWGLGRNLGRRTIGKEGERLVSHLRWLAEADGAPVSLVGHSLGGVMAREYAMRHPDTVRQVICLGSPFVHDPRGVNRAVARLHEELTGAETAAWDAISDPPNVPLTAIFSRSDGIVSPSVCTEKIGERAENIEVFGSHCGLVAHPAVLYAVADRLAQPVGEWAPFTPVGWRTAFYGVRAACAEAEAPSHKRPRRGNEPAIAA